MPIPTLLSSLGDATVYGTVGMGAAAITATTTSVTINAPVGEITTASLTTTAGSTYTLTVTNSFINAGDMVFSALNGGTLSTGTPVITTTKVTANQVVFVIQNIHATAAFSGTLVISFLWIPFL